MDQEISITQLLPYAEFSHQMSNGKDGQAEILYRSIACWCLSVQIKVVVFTSHSRFVVKQMPRFAPVEPDPFTGSFWPGRFFCSQLKIDVRTLFNWRSTLDFIHVERISGRVMVERLPVLNYINSPQALWGGQ